MKTIGVRALKQNASAVLADVARGETVRVTVRGRPVAQIVPMPTGRLAEMIESGQARPPLIALADLGPPLPARPGQRPLSEVLAEMRDEERY